MRIHLTPEELHECQHLARMRSQINRATGVVTTKRNGKRTDQEIELLGTMAECAFCKLFGIGTKFGFGVDNGIDLWLPGDISVDVKGTFLGNEFMYFKDSGKFLASAAVKVCQTERGDTMCVDGWLDRASFQHCAEHTDRYSRVHKSLLRPIEGLWFWSMSLKHKI